MSLKSTDKCLYKFCWPHVGHQASPTATRNQKRSKEWILSEPPEGSRPAETDFRLRASVNLRYFKPQFVAICQKEPQDTPTNPWVFCMLPQLKGHSGTLGDLCSIRASPCPHLPVGTLYAQASLGAQDQRSPSLGTVFIQRSAVRSFCNLGASVYPSLQLSTVPRLLGLCWVTLSL